MSSENEILNKCLFSWDALSENKLEPRTGSVKDTLTNLFW